jgi:hypothetical protein
MCQASLGGEFGHLFLPVHLVFLVDDLVLGWSWLRRDAFVDDAGLGVGMRVAIVAGTWRAFEQHFLLQLLLLLFHLFLAYWRALPVVKIRRRLQGSCRQVQSCGLVPVLHREVQNSGRVCVNCAVQEV